MKMKQINYLGFLSLVALLAVFGLTTEHQSFLGFLGFLYYIRYFTVKPDELFQQNFQKAATTAFLMELVALVPLLFGSVLFYPLERALPMAFGLSFAAAIFVFSILLMRLEWKEQEGAKYDS